MMGFPLAFAAPWVLVGLVALPALWWLLRVTPPRPKSVTFPPLRLLLGLTVAEETPARTPWWLTALRLALVAFLIFALSGPSLRPDAGALAGSGPVWLVVDNGWSAAPDWQNRVDTARAALDDAAADGRPVVIVATAEGPAQDLAATTSATAQTRLGALGPRAWSPDHAALLEPLRTAADTAAPGDVFWIAEPLDDGSGAAFATALADIAPQATVTLAGNDVPGPTMLAGVAHDGETLAATLRRLDVRTPGVGEIVALDRRGAILDERPFEITGSDTELSVPIDLPLELRNEIARLEIAGADTAGAVQLLDDRWRRRTVGLISSVPGDRVQPLLSPNYFLSRALGPFADVRQPRGSVLGSAVDAFVEDGLSAIVMADVGTFAGDTAAAVDRFVTGGGVLIRFAGPRLAAGEDPLVPVTLRRGGRTLGGALSWGEPQPLAAFSPDGPFADIAVPDDVVVERQVLAEPSADLDQRTWATLADGTPLVTGARHGEGWLVLFHVTADTSWSNLPISGAFVEMLRRTVALGNASGVRTDAVATGGALLPPLSVLDGFGRMTTPGADVRGIPLAGVAAATPSAATPPGLYGADDAFRAINLLTADDRPVALDASGLSGANRVALAGNTGIDLAPWLFGLALLALFADAIAVLVLLGGMTLPGRLAGRGTTAALLVAATVAFAAAVSGEARAQGISAEDQALLDAVSQTRLAYIVTGNAEIDEASRAGLSTLSKFLASRTALEPGEPVGLDPARDELATFPLIYWPVDASGTVPSGAVMTRIDGFMRSGGTVLFDTRDQLSVLPGRNGAAGSPATARLRDMLAGLDIPPLEPVPEDHVLTKSFYLLADFPGRYIGSPLWVEAGVPEDEAETGEERPVRGGDGVSPILIIGNDLAGAWAADDNGGFLYPVVPGDPRQREFAFRAGVNIVMYALTGNYKADQVHIPALLERLGQ
ncbi:DUF4159 domain-containing protein [Methylobrevis albus]|uniref:DUF4159 domain-containing protein n=1 Tax=Methylobrevis albus TaxID=2793297 RepID=A0A931HZR4_9HYPH|nr:DUF4159 domain-containing protein [Methylobrevis albus]MBH0236658.1 DUF4159 domain-containing protein [Methylobrevis albus]